MLTREKIMEILDTWNLWNKDIDTGIPRPEYLDKLKEYLKTDEIISVQGIRRCGKSTILLQLLKEIIAGGVNKENTLYVNFEDDYFYPYLSTDLLNQIIEAHKEFLEPKGQVIVIFDEIQKIAGWEKFVRKLYDRKSDIKVFVTGSSSSLLSSEFSSLLTGRHLELTIYPLTFREFLDFNSVKIRKKIELIDKKKELVALFKRYLQIGGFPKAVLTKDDILRKQLLTQYFNDIITKDIVERYKIRDIAKIKNLALYYATNFSEMISYNSVRRALNENSTETIDNYSHYLESSFLINFNSLFDYSLKKQMANERKVYLIDNGLRNAVAFQFKDMFGNLLENAVYNFLRTKNKQVFYHKEKKETDFVLQEGMKIVKAINVCWDMNDSETAQREIDSLKISMDKFKLNEGTIITLDQEAVIENIRIVPAWKFFLE